MSAEASELVFVYGTLRKGASNHWRMKGAEPLGKVRVRGRLFRIDWYPGLILDAHGPWVEGEAYRVSPELLAKLDAFEGAAGGAGDEYVRRKAAATWRGGDRREDAWVWEYQKPVTEAQRIAGGDWMAVAHPPKPRRWFWIAWAPVFVLASAWLAQVLTGSPLPARIMWPVIIFGPFVMVIAGWIAARRGEKGRGWALLAFGAGIALLWWPVLRGILWR